MEWTPPPDGIAVCQGGGVTNPGGGGVQIWQLMSYGLLRGAFRPGDEVCPLRSYARQMRRLTRDRSRCVLHMQKALTEMNVKLDSVIANITGLTGQRILRARRRA